MPSLSRQEIETGVIAVLNNMIQDWDLELDDGIGTGTLLMQDLAFESIDVVQFAVAIEQKMGQQGLPFEKLFMVDGDYVEDLKVDEVVTFLEKELH